MTGSCSPRAVTWGVSKAWRSPCGKDRVLSVLLLGCSASWSRGPLPPPTFPRSSWPVLGEHDKKGISVPSRAPGCVSSHYSSGVFKGIALELTANISVGPPHARVSALLLGVPRGTGCRAPSLMPVLSLLQKNVLLPRPLAGNSCPFTNLYFYLNR